MCGRYTLATQLDLLADRFGADPGPVRHTPRYNIAPGQVVPIVMIDSKPQIAMMRWGLVPYWAKDESIGYRMINARSETLAEKPSFRKPLESRRCLVPADGFFEWRQEGSGKRKTPMRFRLKNHEVFGFAGLWDRWRQPDGEMLQTFTIITTDANELVGKVHDRMPVIMPQEAERTWLSSEKVDTKSLLALLTPYPAELMESYQVGELVSSPKNDSPECIQPVG